jgi:hypothetical protein
MLTTPSQWGRSPEGTFLSDTGSNHETSYKIIQPGETRRRPDISVREPATTELLTVCEVDRFDTHAID